MNDFTGLFPSDLGLKPQGKSAPMAPPTKPYSNSSRDLGTKLDDIFVSDSTKRGSKSNDDVFNFDWPGAEKSTAPVFDKPIYDDDIFDGVPGLKNTSPANYVDVFASISSPPKEDGGFDDLLASLGRTAQGSKDAVRQRSEESEAAMSGFDDLIPGFGVSHPSDRSSTSDVGRRQETEVPFVVLEPTSPPQVSSPQDTQRTKNDHLPASGVDNASNRERTQKVSARGPYKPFHDSSNVSRWESHQTIFEEPIGHTGSPPHAIPRKKNAQDAGENLGSPDDIWITVSDIPLFTPVTTAPPPSRPPPPKPVRISKAETASLDPKMSRRNANEFNSFPDSTHHVHSSRSVNASERNSAVSDADELENFASGRQHKPEDGVDSFSDNKGGVNYAAASAAAMKEAMDRAEAKFRQVRERENVKASRNKEATSWEKDDRVPQDDGREKQEQFEREQQQKRREEEERERKRLERERERVREIEREKEKARQAVERATREARERAAVDARQRAERAAVEKANAEARERAERLAVQRVQAEARERAAKDAKERVQKAAAEARDREVREKAAAAKAAAEARERAASAAKQNQQRTENDVESLFGMGSRPSSAPRARANSSEPVFDAQFPSKQSSEVSRTSYSVSSSMRKASSTTNIVDDLSSIFGAPSSGEFQEVEGESEDRRRARLERHQRTQERAAKALAEKNERDLHNQREQAERHRIAETLDVEIKRWAAGKQGNLRALLSTLQYVLWPECGWQPVSLTDLITATSVKKIYRKATLCVHPDKVQQKGATLQQKYIAEKVFDLLKEAWNKFNSEELF